LEATMSGGTAKDDAAKLRYGFYDHFLRTDLRQAPLRFTPSRPGSAPPGRAVSAHRRHLPPSAKAATPMKHRPASAQSRPLSAPTIAAYSEGSPRPVSPSSPASSTSGIGAGLGIAEKRAEPSGSSSPQQRHRRVVQSKTDGEQPAFGSMYYALRETAHVPGPGYYDLDSKAAEDMPHAWACTGSENHEKSPAGLDMYNMNKVTLGPGGYNLDPTCVEKTSLAFSFNTQRTARLWNDSNGCSEMNEHEI